MISLNIHYSPNERKIAVLSSSGVVLGLAALAIGSFSLYFFSKGINHLAFLGNLSPRVISPLSFCFASLSITAGGVSLYFLNKRLSKIRRLLFEKPLSRKEETFSIDNKIFVRKKEKDGKIFCDVYTDFNQFQTLFDSRKKPPKTWKNAAQD